MNDVELDVLIRRATDEITNAHGEREFLGTEVVALVAEVRRLRARVADLEAQIEERDQLAMERSR